MVEETSSISEASPSKIDDQEEENHEVDPADVEDQPPSPEASPRTSNASSRKSSESIRTQSSSQRYPALVNSTVLPGGAPLSEVALSMSPIGRDSSDKNSRPNVHSTPTPSTPIPSSRKRLRSVSQSPMLRNVMPRIVEGKTNQESTPSAASAAVISEPMEEQPIPPPKKSIPTAKNDSKGSSVPNSGKGKFLRTPVNEEVESSDDLFLFLLLVD